MKYIIITILLIVTNSLFAYKPGKWSPTDKYVLGLEKNGPTKETVKDMQGKVIYIANYEYDEEGRLIKEIYKRGSGESDGESVYSYEKGRVVSEELFGTNGVKERKTFKYNLKGDLKEVIVYSADGKEILKCSIHYMWNEMVASGEIKWIKDKETEYFSMKKESATVYNQEILDSKKKLVANIRYILDENGKIIKRENIQPLSKRMSDIQYTENGKISEYNFSVFLNNDWKIVKIHSLEY